MALSGCSTNPKVLPSSGNHPPTTPDQVKIYQAAPSEYEILADVYSPLSDKVHWDDQGNADAGFDELKANAARIGANGILLIAPPDATNVLVIAGYHGMMYKVPMKTNPKTAVCQAIWVVKE
jgi:hypothetical protein